MKPVVAWALAALLVGAAWRFFGWQGALLAITGVVTWLLLQFNRAVRTMKNAAEHPVGHVDSAVMMNAGLKKGMTMLEVVAMTRSLGRSDDPACEDDWTWRDPGGVAVTLHFARGRLSRWTLDRPRDGLPGGTGLAS